MRGNQAEAFDCFDSEEDDFDDEFMLRDDQLLSDFETSSEASRDQVKELKAEVDHLKTQVRHLKRVMLLDVFRSKQEFAEFFSDIW